MIDDSLIDRWRRDLSEPLSHPNPIQLNDLGTQVLQWVVHHLSSLPEQPIGKSATRSEMKALLAEPPPEDGMPFSQVLQEFQDKVSPYAFRVNHPRFLAFIPGVPTYYSMLGDWLCAGANFFSGVWLEAAGPAQVELVVLDWFRQLLDLPKETRGILTSGGSEANLTALVVARERVAHENRARAILYVSEQRHWSVDRAALVIGLRPDQIRPVAADSHFRLDPLPLRQAVDQDRALGRLPWAVVANAGATDTGAVDPLKKLADLCAEQNLWFHVDAAYGWPAVLIPEGKDALQGLDRADSVTLDPHKWFAQTFEAGCVFIREGELLARTFTHRPNYLQDVQPAADEINFADHGLALTRRFRALKIWLSIKVLGLAWFRALVERSFRLADLAQGLLERAGCFEILHPRQLSIVCFRYKPAGWTSQENGEEALDWLNLKLVNNLRDTGRAFISSTRLQGRVALRFCFINWRTTAKDVEEVVQLLESLGRARN